MDNSLAVRGSILDVANGEDETTALLDAKLIIVCDRSGSMEIADADGRPRYAVEDEVVTSLQGRYPGKIALVPFADMAYLALDGRLPYPDGGTYLSNALNFIAPVVKLGIRACIICDGYPDDKEQSILVAQSMKGMLDCIFVGKVGSEGDKFMQRLAEAAGGTHQSNESVKELDGMVEMLLLKAGNE